MTPKDCIFDTAPKGCHTFVIGFGHPLNANAISMDDLVCYIENWTDLPPVRVEFSGLLTIFAELGKLGLELLRQEEVLSVYTIERIARHAVN